jgi:O-antigen/teichoic acid export membrane protein
MINVGLNFWLITKYSWTGAVISTLISDGLLVVMLWGVIAAAIRYEAPIRSGVPYRRDRLHTSDSRRP